MNAADKLNLAMTYYGQVRSYKKPIGYVEATITVLGDEVVRQRNEIYMLRAQLEAALHG